MRNLLIAPLWMIVGTEYYAHTGRLALSSGMRSSEMAEVFFLCRSQYNRMAWLGASHGLYPPPKPNLPHFLGPVNLGTLL